MALTNPKPMKPLNTRPRIAENLRRFRRAQLVAQIIAALVILATLILALGLAGLWLL